MTDAVSIALMNFVGEILHSEVMRPANMQRQTVLELVNNWIVSAPKQLAIESDRLLGMGVAVTGYFVSEGGQVNPPAGLDGWALVDISQLFGGFTGLPG